MENFINKEIFGRKILVLFGENILKKWQI